MGKLVKSHKLTYFWQILAIWNHWASASRALCGANARRGRRHRGPSDLGRGYTTIHALSFEAAAYKKKEKKKYMPYLFEPPPSTYLLFKGKQYIYAPAPSAALLLRLRL